MKVQRRKRISNFEIEQRLVQQLCQHPFLNQIEQMHLLQQDDRHQMPVFYKNSFIKMSDHEILQLEIIEISRYKDYQDFCKLKLSEKITN